MYQDIIIGAITLTIAFLLNLRIFWLYKNNRDPLIGVTKPWWVDLEENEKIEKDFKDRG